MKSLSLILRIVAIVAAVAAAGLFFITQGKLAEKQTALETAQQATLATQSELETANAQVASLESRLSTERKALAESKSSLETMRSEMYTARQEVTRSQQQIREVKSQLSDSEETAKRLRTELVEKEQALASASKEGELAQLNERINELEQANSKLKENLETELSIKAMKSAGNQSAASTVASGAYTSTYQPNTNPAVQPASIGTKTTIASVSPKNGLIVLNATPELGLTAGSEVTLVKDLKALGQVKIVSIKDDLAVANILPGANTRELTTGTTVNLLYK